MIVLGIKYPGHDSAAAIVANGQVLATSAQERFDRVRHSQSFPVDAIEWCLQYAGLSSISQVNQIAVQFDFAQAYKRYDRELLTALGWKSVKPLFQNIRYDRRKHLATLYNLRFKLGYSGPVSFLDHHDCHAASAFYTSPFESAAVMSVDGRGEQDSTRLYLASPKGLQTIAGVRFPHSLGYFYSQITSYLGYYSNSDEGTVMGLADYGDGQFDDKFRKLVRLGPGFAFDLDLSYFDYHLDMQRTVSPKFEAEFGPRRVRGEEIREHHKSVAHGIQTRLQESMLFLGQQAHNLTKADFLCLAGGTALNAAANGKLMEELPFKSIYVQPASGDDGSAMGAALLQYFRSTQTTHNPTDYWSPYLGYETKNGEIESSLRASDLDYQIVQDPERTVAWLLAHQYIVGWYQGRAEFGPRALGNRCILASPFPASMKDRVNQIKRRDWFRPFAPAILVEEMPRLFEFWRPSPYMTFAYPLNAYARERIPAVTHVNGTARVQTVEEFQNPRFHKLLKRYKELAGVGVLLSTSMNGPREPIINTPAQAIALFRNTEMDALLIDNVLVTRPECGRVLMQERDD